MKTHFFTYGGGSDGWRAAARRLVTQAKALKIFDRVELWTDARLKREFPQEIEAHSQLMKRARRGNGYWWWKPFLAVKMLESMQDGDVLCYLDAGCELNPNGLPKLRQYIDRAANEGGLFFQVWHKEKYWNKMDTLLFFGAEANRGILEGGQIESGTWLMRKGEDMLDAAREWERVHHLDDHHHATDARSKERNLPTFREHRHDQSILSLIVKTRVAQGTLKAALCSDQRCWPGRKYQPGATKQGFMHREAAQQPFLVMRNPSGQSKRPNYSRTPWSWSK